MIDDIVYKDQNKQNWELLRIGNGSIAFRRNFDTCDSEDLRMHVSTFRSKIIYYLYNVLSYSCYILLSYLGRYDACFMGTGTKFPYISISDGNG